MSIKRKASLNGLTSGHIYIFRVAAVGADPSRKWSDQVSQMVIEIPELYKHKGSKTVERLTDSFPFSPKVTRWMKQSKQTLNQTVPRKRNGLFFLGNHQKHPKSSNDIVYL